MYNGIPQRGDPGFRPWFRDNPTNQMPGYAPLKQMGFVGKGNPTSDAGYGAAGPAMVPGKGFGLINDSGMGPSLAGLAQGNHAEGGGLTRLMNMYGQQGRGSGYFTAAY